MPNLPSLKEDVYVQVLYSKFCSGVSFDNIIK